MSDLLRTNLSPSRPFVQVQNLQEDKWSSRWEFDILSWIVEVELQKKDNKKSWLFACGLEYAAGCTGWPRYEALRISFSSSTLRILPKVRRWLERGPYDVAGNEALGQLIEGIYVHVEYIAEVESNIFGIRHMERMQEDGLSWLKPIPPDTKRVLANLVRVQHSSHINSFRAHIVNCEGADLTYHAAYDAVAQLWWGRYHTQDEIIVWEGPKPSMHASDFLGLTLR